MNLPWILGLLACAIYFSYFEWRAFKHPERNNTLSRFVWGVGQKWPLSLVLYGMLVGGLAVHFFWNWCPAITPPGIGG